MAEDDGEDVRVRATDRTKTVPEMVAEGKFVGCLAPMVRYSRLPYRVLCRRWGCDCAYSPMLMADSFVRSRKARDADLTTNEFDRPLVVQFAAHDAVVFGTAAALVSRDCDGIDLNCGCPETWVHKQGDGSALLDQPELVADMVRQAAMQQSTGPTMGIPVSIKMRVRRDIRQTVELAQRAEHAGAGFLVVHGRRRDQGCSGPADMGAVGQVKASVRIPVIANGGITTLQQAMEIARETHVDGAMSAMGLLHNPAMYGGYERTPVACVRDWIHTSAAHGMICGLALRHLAWMTHLMHRSAERRRFFNTLTSMAAAEDYMDELLPPTDGSDRAIIDDIGAVWPRKILGGER